MSQSDHTSDTDESSFGSNIMELSILPEQDISNDHASEQSVSNGRAADISFLPATKLIDNVAAANDLFQVARMAFVDDPIFYTFNYHHPPLVNLKNIKADVDGWKVSFVAKRNQGFFDFLKVSQDPEVILFRRPKQLPRMLWKESCQSGVQMRDLSALAGVRLGRLNR